MEKSITFQNYLSVIKPEIDERIEFITTAGLVDPDVIPLLLNGKRLRGGLLMLVYESISKSDNYNKALDLACALELAHSASLILDDMIDEDDIRRGLPTLHLTHGHKKAMLEAIGILSLPYDLAANSGSQYVSMLADTQRIMVSGAVKELFKNPDLPASKLYDMIITHKTGRLFSLAAKWGYMAALGLPKDAPGAFIFGNYGLHCGKAMQTADDITDLYEIMGGEKTSNFGSEILLLSCVGVDGLAKEFMRDLKNRDLDFSKVNKLKHTIHNTLVGMHDKEIEKATSCVDEMSNWYNINHDNKERLKTAPREIVKVMKGEHGDQK
jgi:geranylgeranyl pyrophosphate synthase